MTKITEIGLHIRLARKAKGWTQNDLAEMCNITPKTLAKLENGTPPDKRMNTLHDILTAVGLQIYLKEEL